MLTLFSIPKAFAGRAAVIQDNAIASWKRLGADCEIVLFGDDAGVAEAAARHGVRHVPKIARGPEGTPLLHDVFAQADTLARHPILCLVNSDIVLLDDFLPAARRVAGARDRFLMVSSRFNLRIEQPLQFVLGWERNLRTRARAEARMYPAAGSDIFVYPRGLFGTIPPFAIGRGYWDFWLMWRARQRGASLIDATPAVTAVHHDHDYAHVAGAPSDATSDWKIYALGEPERNLALVGGVGRHYTVYDATEILTGDGILVSTLRPSLISRRLKALARRGVSIVLPRAYEAFRRRRQQP